jgi:O-antigen/teichoic acid export membrane protein
MSIAKKSTYDLASQFLIILATSISGIVVARVLGYQLRGKFVLVLAASTQCLNTTNLGIGIANTFIVGKDRTRVAEMHTLSLVLLALITAATFVAVYFFGDTVRLVIFKDVARRDLLIGIGLLPFALYFVVWSAILVGLGEIKLLSLFNTIYYSVQSLAFIVILIVFKGGVSALIISWATIYVLAVGVMLVILSRRFKLLAPFSFSLVKKTLSFGGRAYVGNVASSFLTRNDVFFLSGRIGAGAVGIYQLAQSLVEKMWLIAAAVEKGAASKIIGCSKEEASQLIIRAFRNTLFLSVIIIMPVFLLSRFIIVALYGRQYEGAVEPFRILLWGVTCFGLSRVFALYFTGNRGKPHVPTMIAWVVLVRYNMILCDIVIGRVGWLAAAAWVTASTYLVQLLIYFFLFLNDTGVRSLAQFFIIRKSDLETYRNLLREGIAFLRRRV